MLEVDEEAIHNLRCILLIMEVASGLKVNLNKSKLFPVDRVHNMGELASIMSCEVESFPNTYLIPLGVKLTSKQVWNLILERMGEKGFLVGKEGISLKEINFFF